MILAYPISIFLVILGLVIAFTSLWTLSKGLWPTMVYKSSRICERGLWKSFLLGLPITVVAWTIALVCTNVIRGGAAVIGLAIICLYLVYANVGVAGLVDLVGTRLTASSQEEPWKTTMRGGLLLVFSWLLPILGWFFLLPIAVIIGCGARARAPFYREPINEEAPRESVSEKAVRSSAREMPVEVLE